jgi:DNA-directed RNA polymerase specialized sigma24 family protein
MVRRKIATKARRKAPEPLPDGFDKPADTPAPPDRVADRLLLWDLRDRLPPAERDLFDQLASGRTWREIAAATGDNPDTLRMRLRRAIARTGLAAGEVGHGR